jgi:hypothetical protein
MTEKEYLAALRMPDGYHVSQYNKDKDEWEYLGKVSDFFDVSFQGNLEDTILEFTSKCFEGKHETADFKVYEYCNGEQSNEWGLDELIDMRFQGVQSHAPHWWLREDGDLNDEAERKAFVKWIDEWQKRYYGEVKYE